MKAGWLDGEGTWKCAFSPNGSLAADTVERRSSLSPASSSGAAPAAGAQLPAGPSRVRATSQGSCWVPESGPWRSSSSASGTLGELRGVQRSRKEPRLWGAVCAGQTAGPPDCAFLYLLPTPSQRFNTCGDSPRAAPAPRLSSQFHGDLRTAAAGLSLRRSPQWDFFPSHSKILFKPRPLASFEQPLQNLERTEVVPPPASGARPPQVATSTRLRPWPASPGRLQPHTLLVRALPVIWSQVL